MTDFKQEHPEGSILTMHQLSLYFQATTTRVWARPGQTPTVRVATQRDHGHFDGALDVCSGHESALTLPRQSGEITCHFLNHLQSIYLGQTLLILWEGSHQMAPRRARAGLSAPASEYSGFAFPTG